MKKVTLFVGLFDKDTKQQEITTVDAYKVVTNLLTQWGECGTITEAVGIYKHEDGTIIQEPSLRVEVITDRVELMKQIAYNIKTALNQESVMVDVTTSQTEFI